MKLFAKIFILLGLGLPDAFAWKDGYQAVGVGNNLLLNTPYGSRVYFGDVGFDDFDSWRIEIPIADIRQPGKKDEEKGGDGGEPPGKPFASLDDNSLLLAANDLFNQAKFREALGFVEEMIRRNEKNARAWTMRGSLYHALGQKDLARTAWQEALKVEPENKEVKKILENYQ